VADKDELYDRDDEKDNLIKILSNGRSVAVTAIRGMGKSSLVKASTAHIDKVVWVDLEDVYNSLDLAQQLINGFTSQKISGINEKAVELNKVKQKIGAGNFSAKNFLNIFFGSNILSDSTVIVIDEITRARILGNIYNHFMNILYRGVKEGRFQIVIISSEIGALYETLKSKQLPFSDILELIDLKPFDEPTSLNFLYDGLEFYGAKCSKWSVSEYYRVSEGIPVWLTLSGVRMVEGLCSPNGIYTDDRAVKYVLKQIVGLSKKEIEMLRLISKRQHMGLAGTHLRRSIDSLIKQGLVVKTSSGLMIPDPLMEYMLRNEIL
jgi:AAA+ ATPase superfamily predicted ATPase